MNRRARRRQRHHAPVPEVRLLEATQWQPIPDVGDGHFGVVVVQSVDQGTPADAQDPNVESFALLVCRHDLEQLAERDHDAGPVLMPFVAIEKKP